MAENIKARWLVDHEQTKIAPKTLSTQIINEDGTRFKDAIETSISEIDEKIVVHSNNSDIHVTAEEKEGYATKEYVEGLYNKLSSSAILGFYCIEDVTIITNGVSKIYPANSNVEITFTEEDTFEIVPTSDNSILSLTAFPGALEIYYPWLEGVKQFSNILFNMNNEAMYTKWSQGNQGAYQVQFAQYTNCIFWSDNPYISDVAKRTNYTLCATTQLPLCYSTIPENTFKSFYLAFGANSDPNWSNPLYKNSFAQATWATQAFSYYGARIVGYPGHDSSAFTITLPKDCRGLMFDARNIEAAGTFDAINTTNFGAKSGSWREAFGDCPSLRRLYIKNLKVGLNISWSPIDYNSISYIISKAANTNAITISVSPYTYNLLSDTDFEAATAKNITIELITTNYVEDKRLGEIANKAEKTDLNDYYTKVEADQKLADLVNSAPETLDTLGELADAFNENNEIVTVLNEAITNKADKSELFSGSWNDLEDKPFGYKDDYVTILEERTYTNNSSIPFIYFNNPGNYSVIIDQKDTYIITKSKGPSSFGDSTYQEYPFFMEQYSGGNYRLSFKDGQSHSVEFKQLQTIPFPIDEVFIPETFAQVDYVDTQINTHTHDFETLTNKPFYENVTLTLISQGTRPGAAIASFKTSVTEGEYSVKFNGVEYIIFIDENTTEIRSEDLPFIISKTGNQYIGINWLIQSVDTTIEQYSYEVSLIERDLKQLDKKFIPNEIVDKVENSLTNEDILIITLTDEDILTDGWKDLVREASAKGQYILIKLNNVYYNVRVTDDGYCEGYAPISWSEISCFKYNLNQDSGSQIVTAASPLEEKKNKISNWSDEKSGSTTYYPSIKAMEEYVDNKAFDPSMVENKQDKITGTEGQIVQIDANGNPVATDLELITIDDIDAICGATIQAASEVTF